MPWPKGQSQNPASIAKRSATVRAGGARRRIAVGGMWRCSGCGCLLPASKFHKTTTNSSGLTSRCKACHREQSKRTRNAACHRECKRASESTRRARARAQGGVVSASDYQQLATILGAACLRCGSTGSLQWDHIVPLARGGEHRPTNLQPLCRRCNETKQARTADYRTAKQQQEIAAVWIAGFTKENP